MQRLNGKRQQGIAEPERGGGGAGRWPAHRSWLSSTVWDPSAARTVHSSGRSNQDRPDAVPSKARDRVHKQAPFHGGAKQPDFSTVRINGDHRDHVVNTLRDVIACRGCARLCNTGPQHAPQLCWGGSQAMIIAPVDCNCVKSARGGAMGDTGPERSPAGARDFSFSIDRGGTFTGNVGRGGSHRVMPHAPCRCHCRLAARPPLLPTSSRTSACAPADVYAEFTDASGERRTRVLKLLSEDPANYPDAPREGIRRVLESATGVPHPRGAPLDTSRIAAIRMGTTVGWGRHTWAALYCLGVLHLQLVPAAALPPGAAARLPLPWHSSPPGHPLCYARAPRRWPPTRCWSARASAQRWW